MTPLENFNGIYFKREDLNPSGSVKDRWLSQKIVSGQQYVISSSGNAAISAQYFNPNVTVFVSPKTNPSKLKLIKNYHLTSQPQSDAFKYAKTNNLELLRQSTDPVALEGYGHIAEELLIQLPQITSIFIPVGSGTTLLGLAHKLPSSVKVFAVQPASHCPIASFFDKNFISETETITDALSVKLLPLKNKILKTIKYGIVVQNSAVIKYVDKFSPETALCLAGLEKAKNLFEVGDYPVILVTGVKR